MCLLAQAAARANASTESQPAAGLKPHLSPPFSPDLALAVAAKKGLVHIHTLFNEVFFF